MQKTKAMTIKQRRVRKRMSLSSENKDKSDIGNKSDSDQAKHKYLLQL